MLVFDVHIRRSLTKMWVSHSLEQGDIGRILEPLLLLLLHPSTARISRFYCEREKKRKLGINRDAEGEQEDEDVHDGILEDINDDTPAVSGGTEGLKSSGSKERTGRCLRDFRFAKYELFLRYQTSSSYSFSKDHFLLINPVLLQEKT